MTDATEKKKDQTTPAKKEEWPEWARTPMKQGERGTVAIPMNFPTFQAAWDFCSMLVKTGFLPQSVQTPGQAMAIAAYGQELGFPLMSSFRLIHLIKMKPSIASEGMLAKFYQRGGSVDWLETTNEKCVAIFTRKNGNPFKSTFEIADAKRAGLLSKDNWKNWPKAMLIARCVSQGIRATDPECVNGLHTPDEMGAVEHIDGTVIDVEAEPTVHKDVDLRAPMSATTPEEDLEKRELDAAEANASVTAERIEAEAGEPEPVYDSEPETAAKEEKDAPATAATSGDDGGLFD